MNVELAEEDTNLFKKRSRLDVRKFSFSNRVIDKWNSLTDTCVNCITVNNFKDHVFRKNWNRKPVLLSIVMLEIRRSMAYQCQ